MNRHIPAIKLPLAIVFIILGQVACVPDIQYTVSAIAGAGGDISPTSRIVNSGKTVSFTVTADTGFTLSAVTGCDGSLAGDLYATGPITANCTVEASFLPSSKPNAPVLSLEYGPIKSLRFSWSDVTDATQYKLMENPDGISGFNQVGRDIATGTQVFNHVVPLYKRMNAQYLLQACSGNGCEDSNTLSVSGTLVDSVGKLKAADTSVGDKLGGAVSISADGNTLAVGAIGANSNSGAVCLFSRNGSEWSGQDCLKGADTLTGGRFGVSVSISANGDTLAVGASGENSNTGAVYVFERNGTTWDEDVYLKLSIPHPDAGDRWGGAVSISADGNTLAVGGRRESSAAAEIDGDASNNNLRFSGAVYVFTRSGTDWPRQAYLKAANSSLGAQFGGSVSTSADGNTLVVGGSSESTDATQSGAVYVFTRDNTTWSQAAYLKASNIGEGDRFGGSVAISGDGKTLVAGAIDEDSPAFGTGGNEGDGATDSGAVYVFELGNDDKWTQQEYLKASNTGANDEFGGSVSISSDGNTLVAGAAGEDSDAIGVDGINRDGGADDSGAAYVFVRSGSTWSQQAYIKAKDTAASDEFGESVSISDDSNTLSVGAAAKAGNSGAVYLY